MGGLCASSVCSLAQVAGCWARICLDGLQSDTLSGIATVSELLLQESETDSCPPPPSSGMFVSSYSPVQLAGTEDLSMWLQAAFPVSRFQSQEVSSELTTRETCGRQQSSAFASYDPDSHSWRMSQGWLLADISAPSWETWPRAGMTQNGAFYPQPKWERRTNEIDCGLHVPTPRSREAGDYQYSRGDHSKPTPTLSGFVKSFPTPTVHDAGDKTKFPPVMTKSGTVRHLNRAGGQSRASLSHVVKMFPTPKAYDAMKVDCQSERRRNAPSLVSAVVMYPTPQASDADKWSNQSLVERMQKGQQVRLPTAVSPEGGNGSKLNPTWVEWLMGWVPGWTSLEPLPIDEFRRWENEQNWNDELGIPRVAEGVADRNRQIMAIGNGQVPQCMAMAWKLLMEER